MSNKQNDIIKENKQDWKPTPEDWAKWYARESSSDKFTKYQEREEE